MIHCNNSSLKPAIWPRIARPMCDGRPFASPLSRRLAGRGPSSRGFPFGWALQFAVSLARCLTLQDAAPRPHDTLSCPFLHCPMASAKSIYIDAGYSNPRLSISLVTRRYRPSPLHAYKCGPCPMSGWWLHLEDLINPVFHCLRKIPINGHLEDALLAPPQALQPHETQRGRLHRNTSVHIPDGGLRCVTWNTRGLVGSPFSSQTSRERKQNYFSQLTASNDIIYIQENSWER